MIAINKQSKERFIVTNYKIKVIEKGSDTDFGKNELWIYRSDQRRSIKVERKDYKIVDNWDIE